MGNSKAASTSLIEVVAGGGGAKGPALIGGFRALEECRVAVGKLTGVSIGSLLATFYANGFNSREIEELFVAQQLRVDVAARVNSPFAWLSPKYLLGLGVVNLRPGFEEIIRTYGLKPRPNLRIVAYNVVTRRPVVFEGTRYDLATALTASCAIPGLMRPVLYWPSTDSDERFVTKEAARSMARAGLLVDGGVHHMQPSQFCKGPAIVFKLGMVSRLPGEWIRPVEAWFHGVELMLGGVIRYLHPDHDEDIVIEVGPEDVGAVSFSTSAERCRQMVDDGYRIAHTALRHAIRQGRVPTLEGA